MTRISREVTLSDIRYLINEYRDMAIKCALNKTHLSEEASKKLDRIMEFIKMYRHEGIIAELKKAIATLEG
jgi:hypothetical protein